MSSLLAMGIVSPTPTPESLDRDAKPVFSWSVPSRYGASWEAWKEDSASYDPAYIHPRGWSIVLDACASKSVRRIHRYTFEITGIGHSYKLTHGGPACRVSMHELMPRQGFYRVGLTLHTDRGVSVKHIDNISIRDHLIVSIGDSLASGEGNPDRPGEYIPFRDSVENTGGLINGKIKFAIERRPAQWKDRRCHRSARSGPALAAQAIEEADPHTSVTFLSFACSGAEITHLWADQYEGTVPVGSALLSPQVEAVRSAVRAGTPAARPIDALLVTAGINDLHFSDIVLACAQNNNRPLNHVDCVYDSGIRTAVNEVSHRYDLLASAIDTRLPGVRETYINRYPVEVLKGGGCGDLGRPLVGIDRKEADAMTTFGSTLNMLIHRAAGRHRNLHWNDIQNLTKPFSNHAYCASDPWFRGYENSWMTQGDERATVHPNAKGHAAFASLLRQAIVINQRATPYVRATLVLDAVKARKQAPTLQCTPVLRHPVCITEEPPDRSQVDLTIFRYPEDYGDSAGRLTIPQDGQWTPVPADKGTFTYEVFLPPASPRHTLRISFSLNRDFALHHDRQDNYGAGAHEVVQPNGDLAIRYHITVQYPRCQPPDLCQGSRS
ncbi:SGNH/GDSL hydrolase family protein [Microbispora triticiradicis]|uniref:SGNH/GDSL hydrolase family protein n=1 Tax=Microbispora triticiradicis TaxID=2200763 RepID=UPI0014046A39|nr:SGNH/GDSL hydrolase family protein [Microbispora triticiradicis]